MKKAHPERSEAQVQSELMQWVEENHERIYNPFLMLKGKLNLNHNTEYGQDITYLIHRS